MTDIPNDAPPGWSTLLSGRNGVYALVGALIYGLYGFAHSKLAKGIDITEDTTLESAVEAMGHGVDNKKD